MITSESKKKLFFFCTASLVQPLLATELEVCNTPERTSTISNMVSRRFTGNFSQVLPANPWKEERDKAKEGCVSTRLADDHERSG